MAATTSRHNCSIAGFSTCDYVSRFGGRATLGLQRTGKRFARRDLFAIVAVASTLLLTVDSLPVHAEEQSKVPAEEQSKVQAEPSVVVKLDGGLPAGNLLKILNTLSNENLIVRTTLVPIKPGEASACDVLIHANFPPPCGDFLPYVGKLNPGVNLNTLAGTKTLALPETKIDVQRVQRYFTRTTGTEAVVSSLVQNWSPLGAKVVEVRPTEVGVEYDRYAVQFFRNPLAKSLARHESQ